MYIYHLTNPQNVPHLFHLKKNDNRITMKNLQKKEKINDQFNKCCLSLRAHAMKIAKYN